MRQLKGPRGFMALFALGIALLAGVFVQGSWASAPVLYTFGPRAATCDRTGVNVAAGFQGEQFGIELQGFQKDQYVFLSFTFPDGRVFGAGVAQAVDQFGPPVTGLDGEIDMPENFPTVLTPSAGGDFFGKFSTTGRWPYGCYTFTAFQPSLNRQAQGSFVVVPGGAPGQSGLAILEVLDNTTNQAAGQHGAIVNIFGRGFRADEVVSIWVTAPDGTVLDYTGTGLSPQVQASTIGSIQSTFLFGEAYPVGRYTFTALGTSSGYRVFAPFDLAARPSVETGYAELRVAFPPRNPGQRAFFEVQGKRFNPYEMVDIWVTLPDNSVRGLPSQQANEYGEFFVIVDLDERLPVGTYSFTARGRSSGFLEIVSTFVQAGSPNVTNPLPDPNPQPQVDAGSDPGPSTEQPGF